MPISSPQSPCPVAASRQSAAIWQCRGGVWRLPASRYAVVHVSSALWWNHAFEAAGYRNALEVRDLPAGATFLDARYSGIEWIHRAERAWSIGDFQVDPREVGREALFLQLVHLQQIFDQHPDLVRQTKPPELRKIKHIQ